MNGGGLFLVFLFGRNCLLFCGVCDKLRDLLCDILSFSYIVDSANQMVLRVFAQPCALRLQVVAERCRLEAIGVFGSNKSSQNTEMLFLTVYSLSLPSHGLTAVMLSLFQLVFANTQAPCKY